MYKIVSFLVMAFGVWAGELPYVVTDFLPSVSEMEGKSKEFEKFVDKGLEEFLQASNDGRYNEAYESWYALCGTFFNLQLLYHQTMNLGSDLALKGYAGKYLLELHQLFRKKIQDKSVIDMFGTNGLNAALLTPFQRDITEKILGKVFNSNQEALQKVQEYERVNFLYKEIPGKRTKINHRLKVLTANILCFPDQFSYFFGGVCPWKDRIHRIAEKIIATKADLICLQEVWDKSVAQVLMDDLKKEFSYFVYDIGSQYGTLNPDEIGFNSGLFIASRIPLDAITFTPFSRMSPAKGGIKRGALRAEFNAGQAKWVFVATHLQHGCDEQAISIRKDQLKHCANLLGASNGFILGDLNINAFSDEFKESLLFEQFMSPYLRGKKEITRSNATATDYFNDLTHTPPSERGAIKPTYELLDYCVVHKNLHQSKLIAQEKVALFSTKDPLGALSDHHGILTIWQMH